MLLQHHIGVHEGREVTLASASQLYCTGHAPCETLADIDYPAAKQKLAFCYWLLCQFNFFVGFVITSSRDLA